MKTLPKTIDVRVQISIRGGKVGFTKIQAQLMYKMHKGKLQNAESEKILTQSHNYLIPACLLVSARLLGRQGHNLKWSCNAKKLLLTSA